MNYAFTTPCGVKLVTFNDDEEFAIDDLYQQYLLHAQKYEHTDECYRGAADEKTLIQEQMVSY